VRHYPLSIFPQTFSLLNLFVFSLLAEDSAVLSALGGDVPFEIAVGINGRVWVRSVSALSTVLVSNAILNSEHMTKEQVQEMVALMIKRSKTL